MDTATTNNGANKMKNEMEKRQLRLEIANFEIMNAYKKERMQAELAKIDKASEESRGN